MFIIRTVKLKKETKVKHYFNNLNFFKRMLKQFPKLYMITMQCVVLLEYILELFAFRRNYFLLKLRLHKTYIPHVLNTCVTTCNTLLFLCSCIR